jgi:hypothetical protein
MLRPDISKAIDTVPAYIRTEITESAATAFELLNTYLPTDETVETLTSASAKREGPINSLLVITNRRLIFVAPAPQAVGWRLSTLTKSQAYGGYFFIEGDAGEYSPGLASGEWAAAFEARVKRAAAVAVLANY